MAKSLEQTQTKKKLNPATSQRVILPRHQLGSSRPHILSSERSSLPEITQGYSSLALKEHSTESSTHMKKPEWKSDFQKQKEKFDSLRIVKEKKIEQARQ